MTRRLSGIGMTSARTRERLVQRLRETGIRDAAVLEAIGSVPRHLFMDEALASRAYEDTALPIGHGQTISQPYIVARMTELLLADGARRVLEIGTGSGYQTAVLCALTQEVYSVERIEPLHKSARRCLQELGFRNFRLKLSDGSDGWPEYGPYDAILVTAAAADVPAALLAQLAPGGRLLIPVGNSARQELLSIRKTAEGVVREHVELVNFVPLVQDVS
ncbi:MAG: protein-L-isoaspartate O-methyltransferase [Proteobacteria bacterium]|nr:protein-L-isoaspartate O-methyltransferase [Pseudomonadota bacterium]